MGMVVNASIMVWGGEAWANGMISYDWKKRTELVAPLFYTPEPRRRPKQINTVGEGPDYADRHSNYLQVWPSCATSGQQNGRYAMRNNRDMEVLRRFVPYVSLDWCFQGTHSNY